MLFAKHNFLFLFTFTFTASKLFRIGVVDFLKCDSYYFRFGLQAQCKTVCSLYNFISQTGKLELGTSEVAESGLRFITVLKVK